MFGYLTLKEHSGATVFTDTDHESDVKWHKAKRIRDQLNIRHINLSSFGIGWIIDKKGLIWFAPNVTSENPHGDGNVYQVFFFPFFGTTSFITGLFVLLIDIPRKSNCSRYFKALNFSLVLLNSIFQDFKQSGNNFRISHFIKNCRIRCRNWIKKYSHL